MCELFVTMSCKLTALSTWMRSRPPVGLWIRLLIAIADCRVPISSLTSCSRKEPILSVFIRGPTLRSRFSEGRFSLVADSHRLLPRRVSALALVVLRIESIKDDGETRWKQDPSLIVPS
ncbi:hypothetical protein L1987_10056 [Smallanthus sonchifolius]|uniref:Uncharacterized protein n=1 Tax=Smallanthus sonchifolius TaxID=185202 RepID=A0ACB9JR09_9ASTR|nr:hypothetical protein L1987_10056 [Smallanthus sonchifolius]